MSTQHTGPEIFRSFDSDVVQGVDSAWIGADGERVDPLDARAQIEAAIYNRGGLGTWWGPRDMAQAYAADDGYVMIGAKFTPEDFDRFADPADASGVRPPSDAVALVTSVKVSLNGTWHDLDVPDGLFAPIAG